MKFKLEYIWLDGYEPVPNLRSKTKIVDFETEPTLDQLEVSIRALREVLEREGRLAPADRRVEVMA